MVWQPILPTDWARPGAGPLRRIRDARARQFWDKGNLFPRTLGEKMSSDPAHPQPDCCWWDDIPWDLVALYPPGARWEGALPAAVFIDGPVWRVKAQLAEALARLGRAAATEENTR